MALGAGQHGPCAGSCPRAALAPRVASEAVCVRPWAFCVLYVTPEVGDRPRRLLPRPGAPTVRTWGQAGDPSETSTGDRSSDPRGAPVWLRRAPLAGTRTVCWVLRVSPERRGGPGCRLRNPLPLALPTVTPGLRVVPETAPCC